MSASYIRDLAVRYLITPTTKLHLQPSTHRSSMYRGIITVSADVLAPHSAMEEQVKAWPQCLHDFIKFIW